MSARLLAGTPAAGFMPLRRHLEVHGDPPALERQSEREWFLGELTASGLRGRGGAAFPSGTKAAAVVGRRRPVVVVNGSEGEPMSAKDRVLLMSTPHLVIDGALLVARAVGAREVILAAPADALAEVDAAIRERDRRERGAARLRLVTSAPGYVAGEETALIAHLEGKPALPRVTPPLPVERGLEGRPTLVHNVETLAQAALIARHGARWFRWLGTPEHPGTTLVTISGAVEQPGVYETPLGVPLRDLLRGAGGASEPLRALLVGGYFGGWIPGDGGDTTLDEPSLKMAGMGVGAGIVVALGSSACPVVETARLTAWMSEESAGQCGPCVYGLAALADGLERVATGRSEPGELERIVGWSGMVRGRGACRHPDGTARMIASALNVFSHEMLEHAEHGPCPACRRPPTLYTPFRRAQEAA